MSRRASLTLACSLASALLVATAAPAARADELPPERVVVVVPACEGGSVDGGRVASIVRTELLQDGVRDVVLGAAGERSESDVARLEVVVATCASTELALRVDDAVSGSRATRALDVAKVPPAARSRLVALTLAELLRASWMEVARPARAERTLPAAGPAATSGPRPGSSAERPPETSKTARLRGAFAARLRAFPGADSTLGGADVGVDLDLSPRATLSLRAGAMATRTTDVLGAAWLALGYGAAALHVVARAEDVSFGVGPRLEVGAASAQGAAGPTATSANGFGPVVLAVGEAVFRARVSRTLSFAAGFEAGAAVRGFEMRAAGRTIGGASGGLLGAFVGADLPL